MLYFACKEFFYMTHDEFMFQHDLASTVDLINRHLDYHGLNKTNQEIEQEKISTIDEAKGFFI